MLVGRGGKLGVNEARGDGRRDDGKDTGTGRNRRKCLKQRVVRNREFKVQGAQTPPYPSVLRMGEQREIFLFMKTALKRFAIVSYCQTIQRPHDSLRTLSENVIPTSEGSV